MTASMMRGAFLIGIDLAQSTFNKYDLTYRRLKEFLKVKMRKSDILLC